MRGPRTFTWIERRLWMTSGVSRSARSHSFRPYRSFGAILLHLHRISNKTWVTWLSICLWRCISLRYCSWIRCCSSCAALRAASFSSSPPPTCSSHLSISSCSARRASCSGTSNVLRCLPNLQHTKTYYYGPWKVVNKIMEKWCKNLSQSGLKTWNIWLQE